MLIIIVNDNMACLGAWPLNESEAGVVLIESSLLSLCNFLLISMRTASLTQIGSHRHFVVPQACFTRVVDRNIPFEEENAINEHQYEEKFVPSLPLLDDFTHLPPDRNKDVIRRTKYHLFLLEE